MNLNLIVLSIPIFFVLMGIELFYSWYTQRKMYRLGDAFANIGCGIFEQVTGVFFKVFTIGIYSWVYHNYRVFELEMSPLWVLILFLGVDFSYYWAHRMSHEINLFWMGHVVHHQSEDYNLSVALRQGALQKFFTAPFFLPLAFLGFNDGWFLTISALNTLYQFWIHTEAIGKLGWFEYLFNTPSHHRVHHGRNAKYIDKNHGGSLIIWDRIFRTFQAEEETPTYGITKPIHTFNPIEAHWLPLKNLGLEFFRSKGLRRKLQLLFKGPGWEPEAPPQYAEAAPLTTKFHFQLATPVSKYLFMQLLAFLGFAAWFLFEANNWKGFEQVGVAAVIVIQLSALGMMAAGKMHQLPLEGLRLVLLPFVFGWMGMWPLLWAGLVFSSISVMAFQFLRKEGRSIEVFKN